MSHKIKKEVNNKWCSVRKKTRWTYIYEETKSTFLIQDCEVRLEW